MNAPLTSAEVTSKVRAFIDPLVLLQHLDESTTMVVAEFAAGKDTATIPADHTRVGVYPVEVTRESVGL